MAHPALEEIRAALADAVAATRLRRVAADGEFFPTGLSELIEGTKPYAPTIRKLRAWCARERRRMPDPEFEAALEVVASRASSEQRDGIRDTIRTLVAIEPPRSPSQQKAARTLRCPECRQDVPRGEWTGEWTGHKATCAGRTS